MLGPAVHHGMAVQMDPTLSSSWNKRNVGKCWLKSLTSFKLHPATSNMVCKQTEFLVNNVASVWMGPRREVWGN